MQIVTTKSSAGISYDANPPKISPVATYGELNVSFRLVNHYHVRSGGLPHRTGMRYTAHQLLPSYRAWLAHRDDRLAATVGLVLDSEVSLPLASSFPREYEALHGLGLNICEITTIGLAEEGERAFAWTLAALFNYTLEQKIDELCIMVPPRDVDFWHESLGFRVLARTRTSPTFGNGPAVLLTFSVKAWREGRKPLTPFLKGLIQIKSTMPKLNPRPISLSWREVARLLTLNPEALFSLGARQLTAFRRAFPRKPANLRKASANSLIARVGSL